MLLVDVDVDVEVDADVVVAVVVVVVAVVVGVLGNYYLCLSVLRRMWLRSVETLVLVR